jgi:hypothetical protein
MSRVVLAVLVALLSAACTRTEAKASGGAAGNAPIASMPPAPPPPPVATIRDRLMKATTLADALAIAQPRMADTFNEPSAGALLLGAWAAGTMRWADVFVAKDETSIRLAKKDPDEARGKRMCYSGRIIQIAVERGSFGKLSVGLLLTGSYDLLHFMAAGSSGDLVEGKRGRLCGVVTGKYDYANSGGGTGHAIQVVGMFDLPENR